MHMTQIADYEREVSVPAFLSVKDFCQKFPFVKEAALRWQICSREDLEVFVKPFGQRRVLIDGGHYFELMKELDR